MTVNLIILKPSHWRASILSVAESARNPRLQFAEAPDAGFEESMLFFEMGAANNYCNKWKHEFKFPTLEVFGLPRVSM